MTMVVWNGLQCGVNLPSKARIHSGRSERLEADGKTKERQRKRKKKRTPPFLLSLLALEAVIVVMVIKLQTSMKVYIAVIAI